MQIRKYVLYIYEWMDGWLDVWMDDNGWMYVCIKWVVYMYV